MKEMESWLAKYGQEHLLRFYTELSVTSQEKLCRQITQLELDLLQTNFHHVHISNADSVDAQSLEPIDALDGDTFSETEKLEYSRIGWDLLHNGKVAVLVVAGGQGSRLGYDGPKGVYDIGLPSHKSLFQLQAERLKKLSQEAGATIPWYIMTSPENHGETIRFFNKTVFFDYPEEACFFFKQGVMPAVDAEGKIILAAKDEISLAPSGNGDCFAALKRSGALADMQRRGVEWLFYYNVDNALVKVADPLFLGVASQYNNPIATKVVDKVSAEEKVGILCKLNGHPAVVEYTDIWKEVMHAKDKDGRLIYGLGNISIQLFRVDFIAKNALVELPFHIAHKKIKYIDTSGNLVIPSSPNAYKFERMQFDLFPLAEQITILKVKREGEFAPVKNKEGVDSPHTARQMILELHRNWLRAAGVPLEQLQGREIEISPLISYAGEGLDAVTIRSLGF